MFDGIHDEYLDAATSQQSLSELLAAVTRVPEGMPDASWRADQSLDEFLRMNRPSS